MSSESGDLPEMFFKNVAIDYQKQLISFGYYDVIYKNNGMHAIIWAHKLRRKENGQEKLIFKSYDGFGNVMYSAEFSGLSVIAQNCDYDYESSAISMQYIVVGFESVIFDLFDCDNNPIKV